jgi:hypothetical protein
LAELGSLLVSDTTVLAVAAALNVTVPVDGLPPNNEAGLNVTEAGTGAVTVRVAVTFVPFALAVIVADADAV